MRPEQATFLLDFLAPQVEQEAKTTRRVIQAAPPDKGNYTPHPTNKTSFDLAWHIAASEVWFCDGIANANFNSPETKRPAEVKTTADVATWYSQHLPAALARVRALPPEKLAEDLDFFGVIKAPLVTFLQFLIKHSVHHRGQLSAYLRPMGAKVPDIYGGSADEPFQMTAGQA